MFNYGIFRGIVYLQWIIWMLLLKSKVSLKILKYPFYIIGSLVIIIIEYFNLCFEYYTTALLILYIILVMGATRVLNDIYDFKTSMCLGFLLTFVNSFYWEFMLHLTDFIENGYMIEQVIQSLHLLPVPFLLYYFKFNDIRACVLILLNGLLLSSLIGFIAIQVLHNRYEVIKYFPMLEIIKLVLYDINRIYSLFCLVKIFLIHGDVKFKND